jgi:hypothetical protein
MELHGGPQKWRIKYRKANTEIGPRTTVDTQTVDIKPKITPPDENCGVLFYIDMFLSSVLVEDESISISIYTALRK